MEGPSTRVDKGGGHCSSKGSQNEGHMWIQPNAIPLRSAKRALPCMGLRCIWATNQTSNVSFALNHNVMKFGKKTLNTQKLGNFHREYPSTTNCNLKHELHAMSILIIL
jgi:hypothetical protein